ncbi:DNA sulfur modification protein DndD [Lederbergia citrea]|uniref:DNA sulfur modification protein DndD n=1 Tax=Lederbergia citrea TaxID=2833581 RepID=UPI001BC9A81E|nr:DNA sulfur modification protein DndD [Lederbergia citrea]MBS4205484.1 DNA sulfur modification protein DndD [Lederbergia citrea]
MILNKIQLTNIGPYRGLNSFDLSPTVGKNVILIGGENGAGKTTLLNAIKLGLFGAYSYGFKTENVEYYNRVNTFLNNSAKKREENNFLIKLEFSLIDGFEKIDYILFRKWNRSKQNLKEEFDLIANGKHLSEYDKEVFQSKLKEVMPPQLLDLCLFDGEEIAKIVNENLLSSYLKKLAKVVFNLDLFEVLEDDLGEYSNQLFNSQKMEELESEIYDLNQRERDLRTKYADESSNLNYLKNERSNYQDEYDKLRNDFEKYGGLVKSEREEIIRDINVIELSRKQNMDKTREFVADLLPFYLSKELLVKAREQIKGEEALQLHKQLEAKLTDDSMNAILKSVSDSLNNMHSKKIKEQVLNLLKPAEDIHQIHGASFSESSLIENMYLNVSNNHDQEILLLLEENRNKLSELQTLREKLRVNDSSNEFSHMIQQIEGLQQRILELDNQIEISESQLNELKSELTVTISNIDKIQINLKDNEKTQSSFLEAQKVIALSRRFREIQLKKKLQQVQIEATTMLKRITRKHNYINSIIIDHENYDVSLLDSQKEHLEISTLSAGEKQILLISIIWAIFKCSGRKVPFIFDTLLGRLDKTHKATVLREFIPNCGEQAIILSTDTEIDQAHYNILIDNLAKEYMLDFNVERKETHIINHYFPFKQLELST